MRLPAMTEQELLKDALRRLNAVGARYILTAPPPVFCPFHPRQFAKFAAKKNFVLSEGRTVFVLPSLLC
jgi:hypothetical protein